MERYESVKDIWSSNFGVAKLVRDKWTKELFTVKFIERGHKIDEHVQREIMNHRSLKHPNIVRFKESDEQTRTKCRVMSTNWKIPKKMHWYSITKAFIVAFFMTFFSVFDVPIFWPILLCYWIVLFVLTRLCT